MESGDAAVKGGCPSRHALRVAPRALRPLGRRAAAYHPDVAEDVAQRASGNALESRLGSEHQVRQLAPRRTTSINGQTPSSRCSAPAISGGPFRPAVSSQWTL